MNTFEQTVEEYKEEVMLSQDDMTMEEFYSLELELDDLTVELYKESNNLEAVDFTNEDLGIKALAIANGVSVSDVKDFTIESSKDSLVKRLWEKLKLLIKKAHMFMSKWVSKALLLFVKGDDKRNELSKTLSHISEEEFNKTRIGPSLLQNIKSLGKAKEQGMVSENDALSFLSFSKGANDGDLASVIERVKVTTDFSSDEKVVGIKNISSGNFIVTTLDDENKECLHFARLTKQYIESFPKQINENLDSFNISKDSVEEELLKTKKTLQEDINTIYDKFKKPSDGDDVKDISRMTKNISVGVASIKSIVRRTKDAIVVANVVVKSNTSMSSSNGEDMSKYKEGGDLALGVKKGMLSTKQDLASMLMIDMAEVYKREEGMSKEDALNKGYIDDLIKIIKISDGYIQEVALSRLENFYEYLKNEINDVDQEVMPSLEKYKKTLDIIKTKTHENSDAPFNIDDVIAIIHKYLNDKHVGNVTECSRVGNMPTYPESSHPGDYVDLMTKGDDIDLSKDPQTIYSNVLSIKYSIKSRLEALTQLLNSNVSFSDYENKFKYKDVYAIRNMVSKIMNGIFLSERSDFIAKSIIGNSLMVIEQFINKLNITNKDVLLEDIHVSKSYLKYICMRKLERAS